MLEKLRAVDLIALLVIAGILFLNWRGIPFMLPQAGLLILGYYFGHSAAKMGDEPGEK